MGGELLICVLPLSIIGYWLCYSKSVLCDIAYIPHALCVTIFVIFGHIYYRLKAKLKWLVAAAFITFPFYAYSVYNHEFVSLVNLDMGVNYIVYVLSALFGISVTMMVSLFVQRYKAAVIFSTLGVYSLFIYGLHANSNFLTPILNKTMWLLGNQDATTYSLSIVYGLVKTFYSLLITYGIGYFVKRNLPFFFGYSKGDKFLQELKN